jgi:hypothetical protein
LATIRNVSIKYHQGSTSSVPIVRFIFAVQVAGATVDYLAKLELKLDLNEGSELWNVLSRLIGCKTLQECSGKQFDLDTVKGLRCDIEINHVSDNAAEYEFPLVVVTDIQATGTLVACEGKEGK